MFQSVAKEALSCWSWSNAREQLARMALISYRCILVNYAISLI